MYPLCTWCKGDRGEDARGLNGENNPMYGKTHSEETQAKISASKKGIKLSEEWKAKLSAALSGENHPLYGKNHSEQSKLQNLHSQSTKKGIEVTDLETKNITSYPSIRAAARAIDCNDTSIHSYFRDNQQNHIEEGMFLNYCNFSIIARKSQGLASLDLLSLCFFFFLYCQVI
uniref:GIY-YIG endonuclease n=1 Tax=Morchella brunnea TaxID=1174671 RepID=A0A8K1I7A3_9PEZI|nr:GIY-YIG endonuclease [Morchella brunnea]UBU98382.1 GIY-YIG endonuclease [Morchella brunnea]